MTTRLPFPQDIFQDDFSEHPCFAKRIINGKAYFRDDNGGLYTGPREWFDGFNTVVDAKHLQPASMTEEERTQWDLLADLSALHGRRFACIELVKDPPTAEEKNAVVFCAARAGASACFLLDLASYQRLTPQQIEEALSYDQRRPADNPMVVDLPDESHFFAC